MDSGKKLGPSTCASLDLNDVPYTFFYKQSIFDPRPENCLVDGLLLTSIV